MLSTQSASNTLVFSWPCQGDVERELTLGVRMAHPRRDDGTYHLDPTWQVEELKVGETLVEAEAISKLAAFAQTLQAVYFVTGRCFPQDAEVGIAGVQRPELGGERVERRFRVP